MNNDPVGVPVVTLTTLADGAAVELFQSELDRVLRNIADPNTDAKMVRKVTLEVTFMPDEEREVGEVKVKASAKLAGVKGARTRVFFGNHKGQLVATEFNPKQAGLFDPKPELRDVAAAGKKGA
jgi:hypothetical protein